MAFWFEKRQPVELREVQLPGDVSFISFPAEFSVNLEGEGTLLAYPHDQDGVSLRASSISMTRQDGNDDLAGLLAVRDRAQQLGVPFREKDDKGMLSYDETILHEGSYWLIKYSYVGSKNTLVIFSVTILSSQIGNERVKAIVDLVPRIVESIRITKFYRVMEIEDKKIEGYEVVVEPGAEQVDAFNDENNDWLQENLEAAKELGVKFGSGGELTPEELDVVFSRWMHEEDEKESDDYVANALGAAFGEYFVEHHDFAWIVITDGYGTDLAVRHEIGKSTAFPCSSVQKRIESGQTGFLQAIYLALLERLKQPDSEL